MLYKLGDVIEFHIGDELYIGIISHIYSDSFFPYGVRFLTSDNFIHSHFLCTEKEMKNAY